jgi:hypothetical protein
LITIFVLSFLRWFEMRLPTEVYYHFDVRGARTDKFTEKSLRELLVACGFRITHLSYRLDEKGRERRYGMMLRSIGRSGPARLSEKLERNDAVYEFRITPQ